MTERLDTSAAIDLWDRTSLEADALAIIQSMSSDELVRFVEAFNPTVPVLDIVDGVDNDGIHVGVNFEGSYHA